mgnify:CR=1 FL=1
MSETRRVNCVLLGMFFEQTLLQSCRSIWVAWMMAADKARGRQIVKLKLVSGSTGIARTRRLAKEALRVFLQWLPSPQPLLGRCRGLNRLLNRPLENPAYSQDTALAGFPRPLALSQGAQ